MFRYLIHLEVELKTIWFYPLSLYSPRTKKRFLISIPAKDYVEGKAICEKLRKYGWKWLDGTDNFRST